MSPADQTALVLSGGGAYGAFAVGVMKVLFAGRSPATGYQPLQAGIYTGTSVGAFNAAVMVDQPDENGLDSALRLEKIWLDQIVERPGKCGNGVYRVRGDPATLFDPSCLRQPLALASSFIGDSLFLGGYAVSRTANFLADTQASLGNRAIEAVNLGSFIDTTPFSALVHDVVNEENIRLSPKSLCISATDWVTGRAVHFNNSDFHDDLGCKCIRASAAIPGVFPPVKIGRDLFVDGGVTENTPLDPAINLGATTLHVIYLNPHPEFIPLSAEPNTVETLIRVLTIMLATEFNENIETARWINAGLKAVANGSKKTEPASTIARDFLRVAGRLSQRRDSYKLLAIHRYFPGTVLGGSLGMLDFRLQQIATIIADGEKVALLHDCSLNGCVI